MNKDAFEAELAASGYSQIEAKALDARAPNDGHAHDYDVRGLVVDGIFIVWQGDKSVTYRAGQIFDVAAGTRHSEEIGSAGARVVVGRKYHA